MKEKKGLQILIINTVNDNKIILVRIIVGLIFLSEGIQKFLFPDLVGAGRFEKIGFENPAFWAAFTATFEIICGTMILLGLLTRLAAIPLFIIMITAFITTKWPILIAKGFWTMAHEYRTDFALTVLLIFILLSGGGGWSADQKIFKSLKT
jgi:putative oxidoreductase